MHHDSYFGIGYSHKICEDYALSGVVDGCGYAIVSDGCSSSKESDVGARLLAHVARDAILYLNKRKLLEDEVFIKEAFKTTFEEIILKKCLEVKDTLRFTCDIFDATLLVAIYVPDRYIVLFSYGDGYFLFKKIDGNINVVKLEFESGAPYYLSYEMSHDKKRAYELQYGSYAFTKTVEQDIVTGKGMSFFNRVRCVTPMCHSCYSVLDDYAQYSTVVLASDGIGTFQDDPRAPIPLGKPERQKYALYEIVPELIAYKNPVGEFVTRRMNRINQDHAKSGIVHVDDISFASLSIVT
jgi:hypothetical protein